MSPSPVSTSTSNKRVVMNSSKNSRRTWGPGKTPMASNEEAKPVMKKDIGNVLVKNYANTGNGGSLCSVKSEEEIGKPQGIPNPSKKLYKTTVPNEPEKKPTEEVRDSPVMQEQNKEGHGKLPICESGLEENGDSKANMKRKSPVPHTKDMRFPRVQNKTQQFTRQPKQFGQIGMNHNQNNVQTNAVPRTVHSKANYLGVHPQRGFDEEGKPGFVHNRSPPVSGIGNTRQVGALKYRPPGFPMAPPGFSANPPGVRYLPPTNLPTAHPHFGNDQRGGSPLGSQSSSSSNEHRLEEHRMNAGSKPVAKGPNRKNSKKGSQPGPHEVSRKSGQQSNHALADNDVMRNVSHPSQQMYALMGTRQYVSAANYVEQVPTTMGMVQRMPIHPMANIQPVFVDQEYNVAYYQSPNFVQHSWVGVVAERPNYSAYTSGSELVRIQNHGSPPFGVQYMTAPIVSYTSDIPVVGVPITSPASSTVTSSVGPITAIAEVPNLQYPMSQLERTWEGNHPPIQELEALSLAAPLAENRQQNAQTPAPPSTPATNGLQPGVATPDHPLVTAEEPSTAASPLFEVRGHEENPFKTRGAEKANMLSVSTIEQSQRMSSANGKRVPMNARNKDSPNHMPPASPDVQDDVIKFICDSWNTVYQEHLKDSSAVPYHVESCPPPEGFVPFDLEAYWGKRLVQNMTTQNIPTQNM